MKTSKFQKVLSLVLTCALVAGLFPTAALAIEPTDYNYQQTEYVEQTAGVDETLPADDDLNIYVSIDMTEGDHIYSTHTCSNPVVGDPEIVPATMDASGSIHYECATCGASATVEIPQLADDAFIKEENAARANGSKWERWLGTDTFYGEWVDEDLMASIHTKLFNAEILLPIAMDEVNTMSAMGTSTTDDPTTWPSSATAGVVQVPGTRPDGGEVSPVYLFVDYENPDDEGIAIKAMHRCKPGINLKEESVKATDTSSGQIKYVCEYCGSSASLEVPALTLDAFELAAESVPDIQNGVEFKGTPYTIYYNISPEFRRFIGAQLENNVRITDVGTYHVIITIQNGCYGMGDGPIRLTDNENSLTVRPKPVTPPSQDFISSKVYDGTPLISGKNFSYTDVNGRPVAVPITVSPIALNTEGTPSTETGTTIQDSAPAGVYAVTFTIDDENYCWDLPEEPEKVYRKYSLIAYVFPKTSDLFVGEEERVISLVTGNSPLYSFTLVTGQPGFDSSVPGQTSTTVQLTRTDGSWGGRALNIKVPVTVKPRAIVSARSISINKPVGTPFEGLGLPSTMTVEVEDRNGTMQVNNVPVIWDEQGYDSNALTQTISGTFDLRTMPNLVNSRDIKPQASISLLNGEVTAPVIPPVNKIYDGNATPLVLPDPLPTGIANIAVKYNGSSLKGEAYNDVNPPVDAGTYSAKVTYTMSPGYPSLPAATIAYIINQAEQTCPTPTLASSTTNSITLNVIPNAEYSRDGQHWQSSPEFKNLEAHTQYTLYARLKESVDKNYKASAPVSAEFITEAVTAGKPDLKEQTKVYTGAPIAYQVPSIQYVSSTKVSYLVDGAPTNVPPTNAGTYQVTVTFTMNPGVAQLDPITTSLVILKADRNAPPTPTASSVGMNQFSVTPIPGAEYSIDNGQTWVTTPLFENLQPNTDYTVLAKYPADQNHNESPTSSGVIHTKNQSSTAGTVQSAVFIYDGQPKKLVADQPTGCTKVVQTFTGINNTVYGPTTTEPVKPGTYKVAVSYEMAPGYNQIQPQYANLTINKAEQNPPLAPVVTEVTDSTITIETKLGEAYSIDGGRTWSTTGTFTGLNRDTTYTIQSKALETELYKEQLGASTEQKTEMTVVTFPSIPDQTYDFDGKAKTFVLPKSIPGIAAMSITGYNGSMTEPTRVGDYQVTIAFTPAAGYKLPAEVPTPMLHIVKSSTPLNPILKDETTVYNGNPQPYHGADSVQGVTSVTITYVGADNIPTTEAPVNAGTYAVNVEFTPDEGHTMGPGPFTAQLIIKKAQQDAPVVSLERAEATKLTASAIPGAEYSIDGGKTWQDSNVFENLNPSTSYTILVRMKADENHEASSTRPVVGSTTKHQVAIPDMPAFNTTYNGNAQPYPNTATLAQITGVKSVEVMYFGTMNNGKQYSSAEAPVNAGTYSVRFNLKPELNYELDTDTVYADMVIARAPQTLDAAPVVANRTTTTIAVNPVPGAEYSIDNGQSWQTSPKFTGLTPDTQYTVSQRLAGTDNLEPSNTTTVQTSTVKDTGLDYTINFKDETIHFNEEVVYGNDDYTGNTPLHDGSTVVPGDTIYVGLVDDGTGNKGPVTIITLPERPAAPVVTVNPYDYNMNSTTDMEYSTDGGLTWTPCAKDQNVEDLQDKDILVRIAATEDSFHSDSCTVHVPKRGPAPVITVDTATEKMDSTSAMEYFDGEEWIPCLDNMDVSSLAGETIKVRYSCDGVNPASNSATVVIPTRNILPDFKFDMKKETLTADSTLAQVLENENWVEIGAGYDVSDKVGQSLNIRANYDDTHFASLPETITVPMRGEMPTPVIDKETITIPNLTGCEFSKDGSTWTPIPDGTLDVSDMAGTTIFIRKESTESTFASESVKVDIFDYAQKPEVELNTKEETITNPDGKDLEYSTDNGNTWNPMPEGKLDVTEDMLDKDILVRDPGTETQFPSEPETIHVPNRREEPTVTPNYPADKLEGTANTEVSTDGGKTWTEVGETDLSISDPDLTGKEVIVRNPATDSELASNGVVVQMPDRPGAPVVEKDWAKEELINPAPDTELEWSEDGGKTWQPWPEDTNLDVSDKEGKDIIVRIPATDDTPASETTTVTVPTRRPAPDVELDTDKGIITVQPPKDLEWSDDGGNTWKPVEQPFDVNDLAGEDILIREPATDTDVPGNSVEIHIPEKQPTPNVSLDTGKETINTTTDMEYSTDGGKTWKPCTQPLDVSDLAGKDVIIRNPGDENHLTSDTVTIHVPERLATPTVGHTDETVAGRNDGTLTGTNAGMEYRPAGGSWTAITGDKVTNLAPGTYEVRNAATENNLASLSQTVVIDAGRKPGGSGGSGGGGGSSSSSDYTIRFDSNGGSKVNSQSVDRNDKVREPKDPVKDGYVFMGWYTDRNLKGDLYDFDDPVRKSFTLYAKWEKAEETPVVPPVVEPTKMLNKKDHISYIAGRTETTAAPNASITRGEVAAILYRLLTPEAKAAYETNLCTFGDVAPNAWNRTAIATLANAGIVAGYSNGNYGPNNHITRAELATILSRFCQVSGTGAVDKFNDISGHWARTFINKAAAAGIISGYSDGSFGPNKEITRAETVVMLNRILERKVTAETVKPGYKEFSDVKKTDWFYWDIVEASNGHNYDKSSGAERWTGLY